MKKLILSLIAALSISCGTIQKPVPRNAVGLKPDVRYFHSPSCGYCKLTDEVADTLEERFGEEITFRRHCTNTKPEDHLICSKKYGQDAEEGLRIGLQVRHVKFGVGTVRRIEGQGDNQKVTIYFHRFGPKKLLVKFAGLEPA